MSETKNIRTITFDGLTHVPIWVSGWLERMGLSAEEQRRARRITIEFDRETGRGSVYAVLRESESDVERR